MKNIEIKLVSSLIYLIILLFSSCENKEAKRYKVIAADYYYTLGDKYLDKNKDDTALIYYDSAITLMDNHQGLYNNRALAKINLKNYNAALEDLNKAIELAPTMWYLYDNRADVYRILKEYNKALLDWNTAIKLNPNEWSLYDDRARIKQLKKDIKGACEDWKKVEELGQYEVVGRDLRENCK